MDKLSGIQHLHTFPEGERVVSLMVHKGSLYCATTSAIYKMKRDKPTKVILKKRAKR